MQLFSGSLYINGQQLSLSRTRVAFRRVQDSGPTFADRGILDFGLSPYVRRVNVPRVLTVSLYFSLILYAALYSICLLANLRRKLQQC